MAPTPLARDRESCGFPTVRPTRSKATPALWCSRPRLGIRGAAPSHRPALGRGLCAARTQGGEPLHWRVLMAATADLSTGGFPRRRVGRVLLGHVRDDGRPHAGLRRVACVSTPPPPVGNARRCQYRPPGEPGPRASTALPERGHPPADRRATPRVTRVQALLQAEPCAIDLFTGRRVERDRSLPVVVARALDPSSGSMVNLKAVNAQSGRFPGDATRSDRHQVEEPCE